MTSANGARPTEKTELISDRVQAWRAEGQTILRAIHEEAQRHYRIIRELEQLAGDVAADQSRMPDKLAGELDRRTE